MQALVDVLTDESPAARVAAAKELLDRGFGKASTVISGDEDGGAVRVHTEIRLVGMSSVVGDS